MAEKVAYWLVTTYCSSRNHFSTTNSFLLLILLNCFHFTVTSNQNSNQGAAGSPFGIGSDIVNTFPKFYDISNEENFNSNASFCIFLAHRVAQFVCQRSSMAFLDTSRRHSLCPIRDNGRFQLAKSIYPTWVVDQ